MNDNTENGRSDSLVRLMSIVGFVVMICLLAWLAVQVVRFIPTAFSSLADIFESNQRDLNDRLGRNDDDNVVIVQESDEDEAAEEETEEEAEEEFDEDETVSPARPTTGGTPAQPTTPQYKTVVTYKTPVSDPNGYTDLQTAFVAVGRLTAENRFIPATSLVENEYSAVQFAVKNIGTKTSANWHFVAELPNGDTMTSKIQQPLRPQETATLTVVFTMDGGRGARYVGVTAVGGNDTNLANNGFRTGVQVVR